MATQSVSGLIGSVVHRPFDLQPDRLLAFAFLALVALFFRTRSRTNQKSDFPLLNPTKWYQLKIVKQVQFLFSGIDELSRARDISKGNPFRLLTNSREIIVLPPSYAEALNTEDRLSFAKYFADVCCATCIR